VSVTVSNMYVCYEYEYSYSNWMKFTSDYYHVIRLSHQMLATIKCIMGTILSSSRAEHWCIICVTRSISHIKNHFSRAMTCHVPELSPIDYTIWEFIQQWQYESKSQILKKSSSKWLKSGKAVFQDLNEKLLLLCFYVLPEALIWWRWKINQLLIA